MNPQSTPTQPAAYTAWQQAVAGVLAKARRVDVAELGPDPERLLDTETYDGITIAPLYTPGDELPEAARPGTAPYTRGTRVDGGWRVAARYGDSGDAAAARTWRASCSESGCSTRSTTS